MGYEYQFIVTNQDTDYLSRRFGGIDSLEKFLSSAPGFIGKTGDLYSYTDQPDNNKRWPATIHVNESGFCLCIYQRTENSFDQQLLAFLMKELLHLCGRLEVEDA